MGQHGMLSSQGLERTACKAALPLRAGLSSSTLGVGAACVYGGVLRAGAPQGQRGPGKRGVGGAAGPNNRLQRSVGLLAALLKRALAIPLWD